jgi:hypothetical protein
MLGRARVSPDESSVTPQRRLVVLDANAAAVIEGRDIRLILVLVGVDNAVRREGRGSAMGVVDDDERARRQQRSGIWSLWKRYDCPPRRQSPCQGTLPLQAASPRHSESP